MLARTQILRSMIIVVVGVGKCAGVQDPTTCISLHEHGGVIVLILFNIIDCLIC